MENILALNSSLHTPNTHETMFLTPSARLSSKKIEYAGRNLIPKTHKNQLEKKSLIESCSISLDSLNDSWSPQSSLPEKEVTHRSMSSVASNLSESSMFEEFAIQVNTFQMKPKLTTHLDLATPCSKSSLEVSFIYKKAENLQRAVLDKLGPHEKGLDISEIIRNIAYRGYNITKDEFSSLFVSKDSDFYDYFYMREVEKIILAQTRKENIRR